MKQFNKNALQSTFNFNKSGIILYILIKSACWFVTNVKMMLVTKVAYSGTYQYFCSNIELFKEC